MPRGTATRLKERIDFLNSLCFPAICFNFFRNLNKENIFSSSETKSFQMIISFLFILAFLSLSISTTEYRYTSDHREFAGGP